MKLKKAFLLIAIENTFCLMFFRMIDRIPLVEDILRFKLAGGNSGNTYHRVALVFMFFIMCSWIV